MFSGAPQFELLLSAEALTNCHRSYYLLLRNGRGSTDGATGAREGFALQEKRGTAAALANRLSSSTVYNPG